MLVRQAFFFCYSVSKREVPRLLASTTSFSNKNFSSYTSLLQHYHIIKNKYIKKSSNVWHKSKYVLASILTGYGIFFVYAFSRFNYDAMQACSFMKLRQKQLLSLLLYEPQNENQADKNSMFKTGLPADLVQCLSLYFLQLDLTKKAGVQISDILGLLDKVGVPRQNIVVQQFICEGKGREISDKMSSGCQLQQVLELFEKLHLAYENQDVQPIEGCSHPDDLLRDSSSQSFLPRLKDVLCKGTCPIRAESQKLTLGLNVNQVKRNQVIESKALD